VKNSPDRSKRKKCGVMVCLWFAVYTHVDIIDTGIYDCLAKDYIVQARRDADLIHCCLDYVTGSNLLLEKLVSERWDGQFLVTEPGRMLSDRDFV
jgi:hypothetical protein